MFAAKITFPKPAGLLQRLAVDNLYRVLFSLQKNGQILGDFWPLSDTGSSIDAYVTIPDVEALDSVHNNSHVTKSLADFTEVSVAILGEEPYMPKCCTCTSRSAIVMFTHFMSIEPPFKCLDCAAPIALYRLPHMFADEYQDVLDWMGDARACDTLYMHGNCGERFSGEQLVRFDSALSREGRKLCRRLERLALTPVYYFLHEDRNLIPKSPPTERCPDCGTNWKHIPERRAFDYQCDACRLVATKPVY
jgi:predicted  nucleic acid-binding Zn ribbon protein